MRFQLFFVIAITLIVICLGDNDCVKNDDFHFTEPSNHQCGNNCDCDKKRTCSTFNFCQDCNKGDDYHVDESKNPHGSNQCTDSCECDANRTCSDAGFCQFP